ncbi:hypothetical protein CKJ79_24465 [Vibrio coralliilyticus]|nr:hypothetical protein CKJ79_24465 [Vibrio coralliilyticus]
MISLPFLYYFASLEPLSAKETGRNLTAYTKMKNMIYGDMIELLKDECGVNLEKILSRTLWFAKE